MSALSTNRLFVNIPGLFFTCMLMAGTRPPEHPIDLNTATATELMQLPRVGARTAARILAFRQAFGPFRRPEDLMNIKGIGEKAFKRLAPYIEVKPGAAKETKDHETR